MKALEKLSVTIYEPKTLEKGSDPDTDTVQSFKTLLNTKNRRLIESSGRRESKHNNQTVFISSDARNELK